MASETIGTLYPTKIPGYADSADIQAAFRLYHYGSSSYDIENSNTASLVNPSIAYTLNNLQTQVTNLDPAGSVSKSVIDAKGDLIVGSSADNISRLPIGSNNYVLVADSSQTLGIKWAIPAVTLDNSVTLTNKTLTTPTISSIINTGTITLPTTTGTIALTSDILVTPTSTNTLTNKTLTTPSITSPNITGKTSIEQILEKITVSATSATGTINYDLITNGAITYYTSDSSNNWTLNVRGDSSTTLNSLMSIGQSLTIAFLITNGSTPYYQTGLSIDGTSVTPKWQGLPPVAGNASSLDAYTVTIIKTANAAFTALVAQTKFA
jgi:hypothetical protein